MEIVASPLFLQKQEKKRKNVRSLENARLEVTVGQYKKSIHFSYRISWAVSFENVQFSLNNTNNQNFDTFMESHFLFSERVLCSKSSIEGHSFDLASSAKKNYG